VVLVDSPNNVVVVVTGKTKCFATRWGTAATLISATTTGIVSSTQIVKFNAKRFKWERFLFSTFSGCCSCRRLHRSDQRARFLESRGGAPLFVVPVVSMRANFSWS
jgi:hypothetical protein